MDKETLIRLEKLNQLCLDEVEKTDVLAFFAERDAEMAMLDAINTKDVERMIYVMPRTTAFREDEVRKIFAREDLQKGAPETMDGYWQVPRLVE